MRRATGLRLRRLAYASAFLTFFLACAFGGLFGQSPDHSPGCQQAQERLQEGKRRFKEGDTGQAIEDFRAAVELCPGDREASLELARSYLSGRKFDEAEQVSKQVLAAEPKSEPAQFLLAYSYFMRQRFQEAGQTLQRLLAQDNENADAHKLMGLTLFFYKQYVVSEHELLIALKQRPKDAEALYYLGRVYYSQNNFPPAVAAFRRLISLNPKSYKAYDNLGLCYQAEGKIQKAVEAFSKAQELAGAQDPAYDWPFANMAALLIEADRWSEALGYARRAVEINPRSARNQYLLGKALGRANDHQAAIARLRNAAELDPGMPEPHYLLGQLYRKLGQGADAEREFALFEKLSQQAPHKKD